VIYLDSSVALAHLLGETRVPPVSLWNESLVSSRLLEYEVRVRLNARGLAKSHEDHARALVDRIALVELSPVVLGRALEPFPVPVRTLDALHLATLDYLRTRGTRVALATYDDRLRAGAVALGIDLSAAAG
jgi:hypothetical protein